MADKGPSSQGYGFSSSHAWMWELDYKESWVLENYAFELWFWKRLLRVPRIARRSNQSILKEVSTEYSLEGLMLKLKLQYICHLMQRTNSLEKTLMLRKIERGRKRGMTEDKMVGRHHQLNGHESEQTLGVGDREGGLACCSPWGAKSQIQLSDLTDWLTETIQHVDLIQNHYQLSIS